MSKKKKKKGRHILRNNILRFIAEHDPTRLRTRTVQPDKGKGHKERPRDNNIGKKIRDSYDCAA